MSDVDGFCVFTYATLSCGGDGDIIFSSAVRNLSFDADGAPYGDTVDILAYLGNTLLGNITVTSAGRLDFSAFGSITRLAFIDLDSTRSGFGYSTFEFEFADTSTVPLPASGWFLVASLGGIAAMRRTSRR